MTLIMVIEPVLWQWKYEMEQFDMRHVLFGSKKSGVTNFQTKRHQFPARIGSGWHTSNETLKAVNHDHIGHVIVTSCYQYDFGSFLIFYRFLDTKSQLSRSRDMSAPSYFYTNILWLNQNFWYSSRDVSPATPGTLGITYTVQVTNSYVYSYPHFHTNTLNQNTLENRYFILP